MNITPNKYNGYDLSINSTTTNFIGKGAENQASTKLLRIFSSKKKRREFLKDEALTPDQIVFEEEGNINWFFFFTNNRETKAKALLRLTWGGVGAWFLSEKEPNMKDTIFISFFNSETKKSDAIKIIKNEKDDVLLIEAEHTRTKIEIHDWAQVQTHLKLIISDLSKR